MSQRQSKFASKSFFFLWVLALLVAGEAFAQRKVKLKQADNAFGSIRNGERFEIGKKERNPEKINLHRIGKNR